MIKAFLLLFEPIQAWEKVARSQRGTGLLLLLYLLPMIVIAGAVEGYGLVNNGKWRADMGHVSLRKFPAAEAVIYEVGQGLLLILVTLVAAKTLKSLGETFHGRHTFRQAFNTIAHGLSPFFVVRLFDVFPSVSPWTTWAIGIFFTVVVLYQGLPRVMLPDPPHAFGLYLMTSLMLILITGLTRFVTAWYLEGKFKPVEDVVSAIAAKLPF